MVAAVFAGLMRRSIAAFVDIVLVLVVTLSLVVLFPILDGPRIKFVFLSVLAAWCIAWPPTKLSGTPGKRVVGIRICDLHGARIGFGRSILRFVLWLVTIATAGLGFIAAAWSRKRQSLHDRGAGTLVVERKASTEEIENGVAYIWWFNQLLSVLGLALLLLLIYGNERIRRDHQDRGRLDVALNIVGRYEAEVAAALLASQPMPAPSAALPPDVRAVYTRPDGTVVLEIADDFIASGRMYRFPRRTAKGIEWRCTAENIPAGVLPSRCRP